MDAIREKSIGLDGKVFTERRAERRRRALKGATLRFNRGYGAMECVVRNVSAKGAMLSFGDTTGAPVVFELYVAGSTGPRRAKVRWRSHVLMGIEFE